MILGMGQSCDAWWLYVGAAVLYTAVTFRGELSKSEALIFSERNARSRSSIFTIHAAFIVGLFALIWAARTALPVLPAWLTDTYNIYEAPMSGLAFAFFLVGLGLHYVERYVLFLEREDPSQDNPGSQR